MGKYGRLRIIESLRSSRTFRCGCVENDKEALIRFQMHGYGGQVVVLYILRQLTLLAGTGIPSVGGFALDAESNVKGLRLFALIAYEIDV